MSEKQNMEESSVSVGNPAAAPAAVNPIAMLYGEPETLRFLAAVERLKRQRRRKERQTRLAKQRVRVVLRKMREC